MLERLPELGISIDNVTRQLEDEGVEKFNKPFDKLMATFKRKCYHDIGGEKAMKVSPFAGKPAEASMLVNVPRLVTAYYTEALGGLDTLVFAGGIGENAPTVRARICDGLEFLGIELEEKRNAANEGVISAAASRAVVRVIRTDEEQMIARSVCRALGLGMASEKRNSDHARKYISRLDPFSASGVSP